MTPSDRQELSEIMRDLYASGRYRTSGEVLSESWKEFHRRHGRGGTVQQQRYRYRKSFENPKRKKSARRCKTCGGIMSGSVCLNCLRKNPSVSERQRRFMGAELGRRRAGKKTATGMSTRQLRKFARKPRKNPIAIYNPIGKLLPMAIIEIRYKRSAGGYNGQLFKHRFRYHPRVFGMPDGSLLIKSNERLWGEAK